MQLASVKLFLDVAEAGSLSRVAARRQVVQSHISRQIGEFEAGFGGPLFRRTGRGVALTELGERVLPRLRTWLHETEQLTEELRAESDQLRGEVRLGIIPSAAHPLMTHVFRRLRAEHPGVRLNIAEAQGTELDAMLDSGAVDMAIVFRFKRPSSRDERPLSLAHSFLVSAPGDPLTSEPTVNFAKLAGLRMVLPRRPSHWRNALDETARSLGLEFVAVAEADSLTVQKELVANTPFLYTILGPYSMANELLMGRLNASKLVKPELTRHVALALPRQGKLSPASRVVARYVEETTAAWEHKLTAP